MQFSNCVGSSRLKAIFSSFHESLRGADVTFDAANFSCFLKQADVHEWSIGAGAAATSLVNFIILLSLIENVTIV